MPASAPEMQRSTPTPTPEPRYYDTGRGRRAFLIGAGAALLAAAGGVGLWRAGVFGDDGDAGAQSDPGSTDGLTPLRQRTELPTGTAADQPATDDGPIGFSSMAMVGDSITAASKEALEQVLRDRGFSSTEIDGVPSRRIEVGDGTGSPESGIRALYGMLADGVSPEAWVIALGTNDVGQYPGEDDYRRLIDSVLGMLSDDLPLVWVDVYRPDHLDASDTFNRVLRDRLDERGNAYVADWYARASDDDLDILRSDHVHPNTNGTLVFADLVGDALKHLADRR